MLTLVKDMYNIYISLFNMEKIKVTTHFCATKSTAVVVMLFSGVVLNIVVVVVVVKLLVVFTDTGQENGGGLGRLVMVPIANQKENVKLHNMPIVAPWNIIIFVYSSLVSTKYIYSLSIILLV